MKNTINICLLALSFVLITSCDNGYDELNTSKTGATSLDPALILNNAVINSSPGGDSPGTVTSSLTYEMAIVQQEITSNSGVQVGGNYNQINIGNTPLTWVNYYQNVIKYTNDVITRTKGDATRSNLYNMARIIQANAFMILTDTHGSIPYTEAGAGYSKQIFFPKYDAQENIYPALITELTEASAALDAAGKVETADVLYGGNIAQWKKFGYSLLLRAGMRLSKADATKAQATVAAAFAGGVILNNSDNASIKHDANYLNGIGNTLNTTEAANFYLAKPFVDQLKNTNDPRLSAIAVRYVGATNGGGQIPANQTTAAANQFGMPVGSDDAAAQSAAVAAGLGSRYAFSQIDRNRILKKTSPAFIATAGMNNLLLAEAAFRGWVPGGFAQATIYYNAGITAHMNQMASYDAASTVAPADITTYLGTPTNQLTVGTELQQINTQYWIASFLTGAETWANFRRSGFPVLTANPYSGSSIPGKFITRITYPPTELLVNTKNVNDAISAMGGNTLDVKVWWNK